MIFDTHAHYDDEAFDKDRDEILNYLSSYIIVNPGCDIQSSMSARNLADKYNNIYFACGVHPEEVDSADSQYIDKIKDISSHNKCVAIGEIGLDYYWKDDNKTRQMDVFSDQIELAISLSLPVIIHDRDAHKDTLDVLKKYKDINGVLHCFSGSVEVAKEILDMGMYLGFDGPVTYKNARKTIEVLSYCPSDRILIETDSPYMSPVPLRGTRNDSRNLKFIIDKINEVKCCTDAEEFTFNNAKTLFRI